MTQKTHVYINIRIYTRICTYPIPRIYTSIYTCIHACACSHTHKCAHAHMYTHARTCTHTHIRVLVTTIHIYHNIRSPIAKQQHTYITNNGIAHGATQQKHHNASSSQSRGPAMEFNGACSIQTSLYILVQQRAHYRRNHVLI